MLKNLVITSVLILCCLAGNAQVPAKDTVSPQTVDYSLIDTTLDYEMFFRDFDAFLDSLLTPRSYFMGAVSLGKGIFNFQGKDAFVAEPVKKLTYSPLLGYYHKSGLGITTTGYLVDDETNMNLYQASVTPSYDYVQDKRLISGFSYTKYFTKDDLPFYTTPLQNELYAYFTYRKTWIRPTVSLNYGWGSRSDYRKRESLIQDLRLRREGFTYINTHESVRDFSVMLAARHDFYWLDILGIKDHLRFTPQLAFTSGTQKFGFNQRSNTYATVLRTGNNILFSSENIYLDDELQFQPLSMTLFLRGEYTIGKFFIQPQLMVDYYFPAETKNWSTIFSLNTGFIL